jgi:dATP pyrophosphohydrolase
MHRELPVRCYGVSAVVLRKKGKEHQVLLLKRATTFKGQWCQVAGGIEQGETAWQAALREIREETDLVPERLYSADVLEQFYEIDGDAVWMAPVFVAFVDASAGVTLNHEHSEFRWVSFHEARSMLPFPGQKRILESVLERFVNTPPLELLLIETG